MQLLAGLARQDFPREEFEVIVVDDGSREDVRPACEPFQAELRLVLLRQSNQGVAKARQRGVEVAAGAVLVFVDDDIAIDDHFVAEHIACHETGTNRVVLGPLLADEHIDSMPLFEQFHAYQLDQSTRRFTATGTFPGRAVYTANLSLPRELFLRVGGFDASFHVEDSELGVRLEAAGAEFVFAPRTASVHRSDHSSLAHWMRRSTLDGRDWVRVARKHPSSTDANPWRYVSQLNIIARPFVTVTTLWPQAAPVLSHTIYAAAGLANRLGLRHAAVAATTLVYGIQYFAGVRAETGTLADVVRDYGHYLLHRRRPPSTRRKATG